MQTVSEVLILCPSGLEEVWTVALGHWVCTSGSGGSEGTQLGFFPNK